MQMLKLPWHRQLAQSCPAPGRGVSSRRLHCSLQSLIQSCCWACWLRARQRLLSLRQTTEPCTAFPAAFECCIGTQQPACQVGVCCDCSARQRKCREQSDYRAKKHLQRECVKYASGRFVSIWSMWRRHGNFMEPYTNDIVVCKMCRQ